MCAMTEGLRYKQLSGVQGRELGVKRVKVAGCRTNRIREKLSITRRDDEESLAIKNSQGYRLNI